MSNNRRSLGGLLLVIFIVLKLAGVVTWPWIWVLSPLWIVGLLLFITFLVGVVVIIFKK